MEGYDIVSVFQKTIAETPIFFFSLIMLTEPLTTPPTGTLRQYYAGIVGILYAPQMHLGSFYSSPETALLIGNLFSFLVSPKIRLVMLLKSKMQISDEITNFVFHTDDRISFTPGQYMEWTLSHARADSRGNRRYFTLASSPTEEDIVIGVRFNQNGSSFKSRLANLTVNDEITAGQISGDFTLPKNADAKVVLIAGGIGVTPFRSMIKYLLDTNQKRDITLLYTAKNPTEFVYKDLFDEAKEKINLRTAYTVTQPAPGWTGHTGKIDENFIRENVADAQKALFYISGPNSMVKSFKHMLIKMGVKKGKIKTDYFPGFA
jgi:ferredoxin-NADP reductase